MKSGMVDLEPKEVWRWFYSISAIPRPSGNEKRIADFLVDFASERGLPWKRDGLDNVLVTAPGRGPAAGAMPLLLQAHVDIVPEKSSGSDHDFNRDGIQPVIDGDWITTPDTTLGADNGIGVALMLAVLDGGAASHPPLECLFTTDEERGLTGASGLDPAWIDARRMINLDSEDEGTFCIGCAGGLDFSVTCPVTREPASGMGFRLAVEGLMGGHSGMAIGLSRGSSIRFLARALRILCTTYGCRIVELEGGSKRNAIPRTATAIISIPPERVDSAGKAVRALSADFDVEYEGIEDSIEIRLEPVHQDGNPIVPADSLRIVDLLLALPHGVQKMSGVVKGLVETSVNMALLALDLEIMRVSFSARSPIASAKFALADRVKAICELSGCSYTEGDSYPGWMPSTGSALLSKAREVYLSLTGEEADTELIHAGLECGIIGDRIGGMDMFSMGPDIRDVHVPGEKVSIPSMQRFYHFFIELLAALD